jgi:hypothetical protein
MSEILPSAIVLSEGATATTDYFLLPYLAGRGYRVRLVDTRIDPSESVSAADGRLVVISRYLPHRWLRVVEDASRRGVKVVYFMDDDLFDVRALGGLPWRYRWKIVSRALLHRRRLERLGVQWWVSTAHLASKYASLNPLCLTPMASPETAGRKTGLHVCYHGTASHRREIAWLAPVIEAVQARVDHVHFELFGTRAVQHMFGRLPRVSVLHPMTWSNYVSYTASQRRDLALAPLLDGAFNAGRGPTKFYDYARMGAVGLYSDRPPYRGFIQDGRDGLLLEGDPALWVEALLDLARDHEKRERMALEVRQRVDALMNINRMTPDARMS